MSDFNPETALVIILGADEWPDCLSLKDSPSEPFRNSSEKIRDYFLQNLGIKPVNLKYLFNEKGVEQIATKIHKFLENRISSGATDLFIYYVGHGVEHTNKDYYLLLHSTSEDNLGASALSIESLVNAIRTTEHLRRYIILDACFSGLAFNHLPVTLKDTLLFSSSNKEKSSDSRGKNDCTMFTGALCEILTRYGDNFLSFDKLKFLVSRFIEDNYKEKSISPQLNTTNQHARDIRHLPIFHNIKANEYPHGNKTISWHITTSSKGGVGKTLLALLLTAFYTAGNKSPLIIDLNGVNADLKQLLGRGDAEFSTETEEDELVIAKVKQQKSHAYFLGWLTNPFIMYNAQSFFDFLLTVRDKYVQKIKREFNCDIDTVIVDTNYHFCNIFSNNDSDYDRFPFWEKDSFFIYFIWVYRLIQNLGSESKKVIFQDAINNEIEIVEGTATTVEQFVSSQRFKNPNPVTPFIHVINPVLIQEASENSEAFLGWLRNIPLFNTQNQQQTVRDIPELKELEDIGPGLIGVEFRDIQEMMKNAQQEMTKSQQQNVGESDFLKMLQQLKENYGNADRPVNFFPISPYHEELRSYQNMSWELTKIRELRVYEVFRALLKAILHAGTI
jgi:hypothetical protein